MAKEDERHPGKQYGKQAYDYIKKYISNLQRGWHQLVTGLEPQRLTAFSTLVIAVATLVVGGVGYVQWQALKRTDETTREALIASQRAWVIPRGAFFTEAPALGQPIKVLVRYENTGAQPALDFNFHGHGEMVNSASVDDGTIADEIERAAICRGVDPKVGAEVVYPHSGQGYVSRLAMPTMVFGQEFLDGTKSFVLEGCFAYLTFGEAHRSSFCYFFRPGRSNGNKFTICQAGNYAD